MRRKGWEATADERGVVELMAADRKGDTEIARSLGVYVKDLRRQCSRELSGETLLEKDKQVAEFLAGTGCKRI
jgi:hypothetical protein